MTHADPHSQTYHLNGQDLHRECSMPLLLPVLASCPSQSLLLQWNLSTMVTVLAGHLPY